MYIVLGRSDCSSCTKARHLLKRERIGYVNYSMDDPSSRWLLTLIKKAGMTTVPQIWDNQGNYIGGYTDLKEHLE